MTAAKTVIKAVIKLGTKVKSRPQDCYSKAAYGRLVE